MFRHFKCLADRYLNVALLSVRRILKFFLLTFFLLIPSYVNAATYYLDATLGNDNNTGTDVTTPWKTIAKVSSYKFQPGDSILFKRGCIWREQLTISSSGIEGNPITYGAYGTGDKPVISGADLVGVGGWTLYKDNIYVTTVGSITPPSQLYVDGTYYDVAHHPNSGWLLATADSEDKASIIDSKLALSADQLTGAEIMAKNVRWQIDASTIVSFDDSTHKYTLSSQFYYFAMRTGYGYYLRNKLWMLDSPGEWFYDSVTGKLYIWMSTNDNPNGHAIEVSNRSYGINGFSGKEHIVIKDFAITKANICGIKFSGTSSLKVSNLDVSGGEIGIYLTYASNSSIQSNSVQNTMSNGIQVDGTNIDVSNNIINNSGIVGLMPKKASAQAIHISGTVINVTNNTITNSGSNGITFNGNLVTINNNMVDRSCLMLDDCAGIYTFPKGTDTVNTIIGNTVKNSIGNISGTPNTSTLSNGIYLDDLAHDTSVLNNIVSNSDWGIFIHGGLNNTISGNTVYSARSYGLVDSSTGTSSETVRDNVITDNTFESISINATVNYYRTFDTVIKSVTSDYNRYYHPNSDFVVINQSQNYNLINWRKASGQDINSTDSKSFAPRTGTLSSPKQLRIK